LNEEFLFGIPFLRLICSLFFKIFSPVNRFFIGTGNKIIIFFEFLGSIKDLVRENVELQKRNAELEAENIKLNEKSREIDTLKKALKISQEQGFNIDMAFIVGKDIQGTKDWLLINKGSNHGLSKDMAIVSKESALVGKIVEVMPNFSKIMTIEDNQNIIAALIEKERSEGLVKNEERGGLFMDFIPRNEKLEIGEKILVSGMDGIFPRGILIGTINDIDFSQNQLFQKIYISPAVDFSKIEEVFIVK